MCNKNLLNQVILILCIVLSYAAVDSSAEEQKEREYYLEPVVVCPSIFENYYSSTLRKIETIESLDDGNSDFIDENLNRISSLNMSRRGPMDIQSDLQIRGANFEQSDIVLNGIKLNDPQTGHFNLDMPFFLEDFEKISVINGPAASVYGSTREGGSVHFVTKKPKGSGIKAKTVFGEHEFSSQKLSISQPIGILNTRTSFGRAYSGGYRYNTDFDTLGFSQVSTLESGFGDLEFDFGKMDKEFGANGFYSEFYPEQKEYTKTIFASLGLNSGLDSLFINPKIYLRRHDDRFMLNRFNPAFYENFHTNYVRGGKIDYVYEISTGSGSLSSGLDIAEERIDSSNIGKYKRLRNTLYGVYKNCYDDLTYALGFSGYFHENFKDRVIPDISAGYRITDALKARAAFTQSFRVPTFTELYYWSPANMGNRDLVPEESDNFELGLDHSLEIFSSSVTAFWKEGDNLIDWYRTPSSKVYQVKNLGKVDTNGIEIAFKASPRESSWRQVDFSYTYIDRDEKENGLISKYVFDYLKHKFILSGEYVLPWDIVADMELDYLQRVNTGGDFVAFGNISKKIKQYKIFIKADNIFNNAYAEKDNIPMQGRWVFAGIEAEW